MATGQAGHRQHCRMRVEKAARLRPVRRAFLHQPTTTIWQATALRSLTLLLLSVNAVAAQECADITPPTGTGGNYTCEQQARRMGAGGWGTEDVRGGEGRGAGQ